MLLVIAHLFKTTRVGTCSHGFSYLLYSGMAQARRSLSKTLYIDGRRCRRRLWLRIHGASVAKSRLSPEHEARPHIDTLQFGQEVGLLAQLYAGRGVVIPQKAKLTEKIRLTSRHYDAKAPLVFEATAQDPVTGCYASIDLLKRNEDGSYTLVEVKSGESIKDKYLEDLCFQYLVFKAAGFAVTSCTLVYLNENYRRQGALALDKFFCAEDVTKDIKKEIETVEKTRAQLQRYMHGKEPLATPDSRCFVTSRCPFIAHCWKDPSVYSLYSVFPLKKADTLARKYGSIRPEDVPESEYGPSDCHADLRTDLRAYREGAAYIDREKLRRFLSTITPPISIVYGYVAMSIPVPVFDGMKPYEQIPFCMLSATLDAETGQLRYGKTFFHENDKNPKASFRNAASTLRKKHSTVLTYGDSNLKYMLDVVLEPEKSEDYCFVDLHEAYANRWYYHPDQKSHTSLSTVAALLPPLDEEPYKVPEPLASRYLAYLYYRDPEDDFRDRCISCLRRAIRDIARSYRFLSDLCRD